MRNGFRKVWLLIVVLALALTGIVQTANASLTPEAVKTWYWNSDTRIESVAKGDVEGDGKIEIVTGGYYNDGSHNVAQLCVWDGASFALENVKTWYWVNHTRVHSVAVGDVDGDAAVEIVTGGWYWNASDYTAQLCVWSGASLTLENVKTWAWGALTVIFSVDIGDVDGDGNTEIVTGGHCTPNVAQLCVWSGASLTLENVKTWQGWKSFTYIESVAIGDIDGDATFEIVAGGWYWDESGNITAQLSTWSGASLTLENVKIWKWLRYTQIYSVAVGDVDGDAAVEIVTGGSYYNGSINIAQLCVWSGSSLALEAVKTWYWESSTYISSVTIGDVDGDVNVEIVTGGYYWDYSRYVAQLCVWT